jgi:iron-sulfur cluster assembly protein
MTETENVVTTTITITEPAAARVRRLMEERKLEGHALRVFVSGGGCSGMQYGMALEGNPRQEDVFWKDNGVTLIVDPVSLGFLNGSVIDYVDDLMGGGFRIDNPNAVASCGCGQSFRTKDSGEADESAGSCNCH